MRVYLTFAEAVQIIGDAGVLYNLVTSGKIDAIMLTSREILVSEQDVESMVPREKRPEYLRYAHLAGEGIGIREAAVRFSIAPRTISRWVGKHYIRVIEQRGNKIMIDLADISYCSDIYHANPGQGKWLFAPAGIPYIKSGC